MIWTIHPLRAEMDLVNSHQPFMLTIEYASRLAKPISAVWKVRTKDAEGVQHEHTAPLHEAIKIPAGHTVIPYGDE